MLLPILLCGGGIALCWLMMGRMRGHRDAGEPSRATPGTGADDPDS